MKIQKLHEELSRTTRADLEEKLRSLSERGLVKIREKYGRITDAEIVNPDHKDHSDPILEVLSHSSFRSTFGRNFIGKRQTKQPTKKQIQHFQEAQTDAPQPANDAPESDPAGKLPEGNSTAPIEAVQATSGNVPSGLVQEQPQGESCEFRSQLHLGPHGPECHHLA